VVAEEKYRFILVLRQDNTTGKNMFFFSDAGGYSCTCNKYLYHFHARALLHLLGALLLMTWLGITVLPGSRESPGQLMAPPSPLLSSPWIPHPEQRLSYLLDGYNKASGHRAHF
jgi:hypothetical protein